MPRKRRLSLRNVERVCRFVPRATGDVARCSRGGEAPLPHVAGHIRRASARDARRRARWEQGFPVEVTDGHDITAQVRVCGAAPVVEGRKRLARPARICGRLVPTHTGHRIVARSGNVRAHFPRRRPWATCGVAEVLHRVRERQCLAVLQKWLAQQFGAAVSVVVYESFERAIRDLMAINPVFRKMYGWNEFEAGEL